ncbi:MAG: 30S ribosomal subunit protein S8 [uncultured bacterium]|nr:MAG: 30S ribosomal subunit protein S8 [uncultured bacterium]OGT26953.1 MAG: 30S ribosomal protein S8 [Gammaproteobacteria bacterium RIFCSPHIGHO2_02_FULL_42_43]OGT28742.1 MAG: 30S ribosomal protein S8 [Gammaproteobacteria bacterium RIFCSPHIGHO2_01_FULL_42_8]OGT52172.1 MAG: 30S ribosomal protein S8 [Gammaproteobacteria bacterium RIFCSPHIGHO2_12_FULL_41_25]OGT62610.1 MAG: 30S ribosomal protein S8 [Gammaproteobacteria bacterium RIFCSPLOWO2_02_FULL_42_14]OGT86592.1 MAG: 30S ribosomal protein S8 
MSMQDPIADMLVRIKNAQAVNKQFVNVPKSKIKVAIAKVLEDEGYITGFSEQESGSIPTLVVELKYFESKPVIRRLERVSGPSLQVYCKKDQLPQVDNGLGIAIVSTSQGVMTAQQAAQIGQGGEILCYVS